MSTSTLLIYTTLDYTYICIYISSSWIRLSNVFKLSLHLYLLGTTTLSNPSRPCIYRRFIGQYSGNKLPERDGICQTASPQFWGSARSKYQILEEFHKAVDQLPHEKGFSPIDLEKASQESKPRNLPTSKEERAQRLTERRACMRVCKDGVVSVT